MNIEDTLVDINIESSEPLITPRQLIAELPADRSVMEVVYDGREQVKRILDGRDSRLIMKVGPCSIHDVEEAKVYFRSLNEIALKVKDKILILPRVYFEKPRTRVDWPGLFYDPNLDGSGDIAQGARLARELLLYVAQMGMFATTEILSPEAAQFYGDLIVDASIGARTVESPNHRYLASGLSMPVGLKNGTCGSIDKALDAVITARSPHTFLGPDLDLRGCRQKTKGNHHSYMILRGGQDKPNYDEQSVRYALKVLKDAGINTGVVIDASHANAMIEHESGKPRKEYMKQVDIVYEVIRQRSLGLNVVGVMVESNTVGGALKIKYPLTDRSVLVPGKSITDPCLSIEDTKNLLMETYKRS